jgi:hypothetical protein
LKQFPIGMSVPKTVAIASRQPWRSDMRHFLSDWHRWTFAERTAAVVIALAAVMIPAALATV